MNTRESKQCRFCIYLLDKDFYGQGGPGGRGGQGGQGGQVVKAVKVFMMVLDVVTT